MTFTYSLSAPYTDLTRVRFHIGDTDAQLALLSDEEINFQIAEQGSWQAATLALIQTIIARLSTQGDFRAGNITTAQKNAHPNFAELLVLKHQEFGIPMIVTSSAHTYRADSAATEEPDFTDGRP